MEEFRRKFGKSFLSERLEENSCPEFRSELRNVPIPSDALLSTFFEAGPVLVSSVQSCN